MLRSSSQKYGAIAKSLHWAGVVLLGTLLITGFRAASEQDGETKIMILRMHVPLGMSLLVLTIARLVWWWRFDTKPSPVPGTNTILVRLSAITHGLLYCILIVIVASGIATVTMSGAWPDLFGTGDGAVRRIAEVRPRAVHEAAAIALLTVSALHIGAALFHHFILRDGTLGRMWLGRSKADRD